MKKFIFCVLVLTLMNAHADVTNLVCRTKSNYGDFVLKLKIDTNKKIIEYSANPTTLNFNIVVNSKTELHAIWIREESHILIIALDKIDKTMKLVRTDTGVDVQKYKCATDF
jgi:hypothetical protein